MHEFSFSEKGIKKRQRLLLIFLFACSPVVFLVVLLTTSVKMSILLIAFAFTIIFSLIILLIQTSSMNRSMRAMKVCIDNDKVTKQFDKGEQSLSFTDIVSVKLIRNPRGDYIYIIICGKDKKIIHLFGFDRMQEIVDLIRGKISGDADITAKQKKVDYDNPVWLILVSVITLVIIVLVRQGGENLYDVFNALVCLISGSFLLIFKPLSNTNLRFKRSERFLAWGLILIAILMLIGILIPK